MSTPRAALAPLFLTVFVDLLGFGITIPLLPYYARLHGASALEVSLLSTAYSAMQFVFMPLWGAVSDRVGRRPVLLGSIAATVLSMALLGFARSYPELVAVRLLQGITTANVAVAQAYIADATPPQERARAMGMIGLAFGLGFILGPFLGGVLAHRSYVLPGLVASGLAALNLALAWRRLPESLTPTARKVHANLRETLYDNLTLRALRRVLSLPGMAPLAALFFCHVMAFTHLESTSAMFWCDRFALTERETGYVFAFVGFVVAMMQGGAIGPLARRFGERRMLQAGLTALAFGMFATAMLRTPAGLDVSRCDRAVAFGDFVTRLGPAWAALAVISAGNAMVMPSVSSLASKMAPEGSTGVVLGGQQSASSLARVVGPALAGWLYQHLGPSAPYHAAGVGMLAALGLSVTLRAPER